MTLSATPRSLSMATIGRNDPCWCDSGKKFKKCHLLRESEPPIPFPVLQNRLRKWTSIGRCLHPRASPSECTKLIDAHTVQRSRVLKALTGPDRHVLTFHPDYAQQAPLAGPSSVGWRGASTFTGFCGRHDNETFAPLESQDFIGSWQQSFLLGYRAVCHELYEKSGAVAAYENLRESIDRGHTEADQRTVQQSLAWMQEGFTKGLEDLQQVKSLMDEVLLSGDFSRTRVAVIEFSGPLCIATTAAMTPDVDFSGRQLQVLHDFEARIQWVSAAVDVTASGGAVVFCWDAAADLATSFVESLLNLGPEQIMVILPQAIFFYLGNTYFAIDWWQNLSSKHKSHVGSLALNANPYYEKGVFLDERIVPWSHARTKRHGY